MTCAPRITDGHLGIPCIHCGDVTDMQLDGQASCEECTAEITRGVIGPPPKPTCGGRGDPLWPWQDGDESGPWQDNAIRDMEG
jgi:hypothetical protein